MTYGNSSRAETQYDDAGRIQAVRNLKSDGTVISIFTYSYDPANNPTGAEEGNGDLVSWSYGEINQLSRSSLFSSLIFVVTHRRPPLDRQNLLPLHGQKVQGVGEVL